MVPSLKQRPNPVFVICAQTDFLLREHRGSVKTFPVVKAFLWNDFCAADQFLLEQSVLSLHSPSMTGSYCKLSGRRNATEMLASDGLILPLAGWIYPNSFTSLSFSFSVYWWPNKLG